MTTAPQDYMTTLPPVTTRQVGMPVWCNGYEGRVVAVCEWSETLVEVRVPGGVTCVPVSDLRERR